MIEEFCPSLTISMLGHRGVGKTSMIAAMHEQFDRVFPDPQLQLRAKGQTEHNLQQLLIQLKRAADGPAGYVDTGKVGVEKNQNEETHELELIHRPNKIRVSLTWHDYPGGWLTTRKNDVVNKLRDAAIILVAIDAPAMMELGDGDHEAANLPASIAGALNDAFDEQPDMPRLILFVPVRGERWLMVNSEIQLYRRFQDRYARPLKAVAGVLPSTAAVFCPIQTLGSVQFTHYDNQTPMFARDGRGFAPQDCDQPLRYILAFLMKMLHRTAQDQAKSAQEELDGRDLLDSAYEWIQEHFFGYPPEKVRKQRTWKSREDVLQGLLQKYIAGCKQNSPFAIIQNRELLGI